MTRLLAFELSALLLFVLAFGFKAPLAVDTVAVTAVLAGIGISGWILLRLAGWAGRRASRFLPLPTVLMSPIRLARRLPLWTFVAALTSAGSGLLAGASGHEDFSTVFLSLSSMLGWASLGLALLYGVAEGKNIRPSSGGDRNGPPQDQPPFAAAGFTSPGSSEPDVSGPGAPGSASSWAMVGRGFVGGRPKLGEQLPVGAEQTSDADPLSSLQPLSALEYYGSSESAIVEGLRRAPGRRGVAPHQDDDKSWELDWIDFEARPELAAAAIELADTGTRRVCGISLENLVAGLEVRESGLEPADYRVLLDVGRLPEPRASLPAARRGWESRLSSEFQSGGSVSKTSRDCLRLIRAALMARAGALNHYETQ